MNPSHPEHPWQRLVAAARQAPVDDDVTAPYGFATRIAALAMSAPRPSLTAVFDRMSLRALGVACLLMLVTIAANLSTVTSLFAEETPPPVDDPVAEMVDIAS